MTRLYAVVRPAVYKANTYFDGMRALLIERLYNLRFESVGGFTFGYQPILYDSLDDAKRIFYPTEVTGYIFSPDRAEQNAIIEMVIDNSTIISFKVLHTVSSIYEELIPQLEDGDQERIVNTKKIVVEWQETDIEPKDVSIGALHFINQCYQKQRPDIEVVSVSAAL